MRRYFFIALLTVVVFWVARAIIRRFALGAGAPRSRRRAPEPRQEPRVEKGRSRVDIDYSKVRDARFRDRER